MNAITEDILETLYDVAFRPYRLVYGYFPKEYSRNSIQVTLKRLEKKGYIEKGIMEDEICIKLTEFGEKYLTKKRQTKRERKLLHTKPKDEKWDKLWRVVIFDIPEENKRIRGVLRETLKCLEFKPLQKSVWISKLNYTNEIRSWVGELGLSSYILIFETKNLDMRE